MLTEVLKEREAQIELKKLKESASAGKDKEWLERSRRGYEDGILRDQEEAVKRMQKLKITADFQKAQYVFFNLTEAGIRKPKGPKYNSEVRENGSKGHHAT